jgi:hypothetical protein
VQFGGYAAHHLLSLEIKIENFIFADGKGFQAFGRESRAGTRQGRQDAYRVDFKQSQFDPYIVRRLKYPGDGLVALYLGRGPRLRAVVNINVCPLFQVGNIFSQVEKETLQADLLVEQPFQQVGGG